MSKLFEAFLKSNRDIIKKKIFIVQVWVLHCQGSLQLRATRQQVPLRNHLQNLARLRRVQDVLPHHPEPRQPQPGQAQGVYRQLPQPQVDAGPTRLQLRVLPEVLRHRQAVLASRAARTRRRHSSVVAEVRRLRSTLSKRRSSGHSHNRKAQQKTSW